MLPKSNGYDCKVGKMEEREHTDLGCMTVVWHVHSMLA